MGGAAEAAAVSDAYPADPPEIGLPIPESMGSRAADTSNAMGGKRILASLSIARHCDVVFGCRTSALLRQSSAWLSIYKPAARWAR